MARDLAGHFKETLYKLIFNLPVRSRTVLLSHLLFPLHCVPSYLTSLASTTYFHEAEAGRCGKPMGTLVSDIMPSSKQDKTNITCGDDQRFGDFGNRSSN